MHIMILFFSLLSGCANSNKAVGYAEQYAQDFYRNEYSVGVISCERFDSDEDGRVRCNIGLKSNKTGEVIVDHVECPAGWLPQFANQCVGIKGR